MKRQEFNRTVYGDIAGRDIVHHTTVHIGQVTVVHHHAAPQNYARQAKPSAHLSNLMPLLNLAQNLPPPDNHCAKSLMAMVDSLPADGRARVLRYMHEQFGTSTVRELGPTGLAKTRLWILHLKDANDLELNNTEETI